MTKCRYYIGIDSGGETGFAVWDKLERKLLEVKTVRIHQAMEAVRTWSHLGAYVRVEDARQRTWFGESGKEQLQGAGSIKRDAKIWEDYLSDTHIEFQMVAPKNNATKLTAATFRNITKWKGRTTEHARDAAMLVFGF